MVMTVPSMLIYESCDFVGSTNAINICLILLTIYSFIPVSGCLGRGPVHCFVLGPLMLLRRPWVMILFVVICNHGSGVEFKQKFQLASRTSRYKNQLAPQIFYS